MLFSNSLVHYLNTICVWCCFGSSLYHPPSMMSIGHFLRTGT